MAGSGFGMAEAEAMVGKSAVDYGLRSSASIGTGS